MSRLFDFSETKTCIIVGAGASMCFGCFPKFAGNADNDALDICNKVLNRRNRSICDAQLKDLLNDYNNDLERVYDHLPKGNDPVWFRRDMSDEIAERFGVTLEQDKMQEVRNFWLERVDQSEKPIAIFTTNFDEILEEVLKGSEYADGWDSNGEGMESYASHNFARGKKVDIALIKLHGSASWAQVRPYGGIIKVAKKDKNPLGFEATACLEPQRRKWSIEEPYASAYEFLTNSLLSTDKLIIVGFAWREVSVSSILRNVLKRRKKEKRELIIHIFDPQPYQIEERIRLFLCQSGAGDCLPIIKWHFTEIEIPNSPKSDTDLETLKQETSLSNKCDWAIIAGEPDMMFPVQANESLKALKVTWKKEKKYFESGKAILKKLLPEKFEITAEMSISHYNSGWDPGIALYTREGEEILCARYIPAGNWNKPLEPNINGVRIIMGSQDYRRHEAEVNKPVKVKITCNAQDIAIELSTSKGTFPYSDKIQCCQRPVRLYFGAFPWFNDDGQIGRSADGETEWILNSCVVKSI